MPADACLQRAAARRGFSLNAQFSRTCVDELGRINDFFFRHCDDFVNKISDDGPVVVFDA